MINEKKLIEALTVHRWFLELYKDGIISYGDKHIQLTESAFKFVEHLLTAVGRKKVYTSDNEYLYDEIFGFYDGMEFLAVLHEEIEDD